jgi:hypothetical protein
MPVAIAPAWAPAVVTARGAAYLRLADFRDAWAGLSSADRAYFAEELRDLLVDAVMDASAPIA